MALDDTEFERVPPKDADGDGPSLETPLQNVPTRWERGAALDVVGRPHARLEGVEKVTGRALYTHDVCLPGQLQAAVLRSPHPHARIRRIDTSRAEALPGVHAVLTTNDEIDVTWYAEEVPALDERVRFVGDEVAAVAAETRLIAEDALRLIEVDYEVLPHVTDMRRARDPESPAIHEGGNLAEEPESYARGDAEGALAAAEVVLEETYTTQTALHNALEAHGTVATWSGEDLTLYESTQSVFSVRDQMAEKLGLGQNRVRVIKQHMGGGFGAKQVPWKQTLLATLLARRTGRPVQLMLDREAENLATGNRNPTHQRVRLGAKRDGTLVAITLEALCTCGAYSTPGEASNISGLYQHLYACENVTTETVRVYVNLGPAVAFRAPGYVEAAFALESAMDQLARELDMDPLELRRKNYARTDQTQELEWSSPEGLETCYARLDDAFGWSDRERPAPEGTRRCGFGLAAHEWMAGSGSPPAYAMTIVNADGSIDVLTGTQDIGTGTRTVLGQVAAETFGVPLERVAVRLGDTASGLYAPPSAGSFTVPTLAPTVKAAAEDACRQLVAAAATLWQTSTDALEWHDGGVRERSGEGRSIALTELVEEIAPHTIQGHGSRLGNPEGRSVRPFGAQAAEVEVDTLTGEVTLIRIVAAPDCGRVLNPMTAGSQVIGGVTQGVGFALTEERVVDDALGVVLNANLEDYLVPTSVDVPEIEHAMVDLPDLHANATGAKGLGELPLIPAAAAILNAIHDAIGIRFRSLPVTRRAMIEALERRDGPNGGESTGSDDGTSEGADAGRGGESGDTVRDGSASTGGTT